MMQTQKPHLIRLEVNYRGIFQKTLAYHISGDIVYAAHKDGKTAFSNGRYSDDPQRNGIPCANFAYFSKDLSEEDLEAEASASMDITEAEVVVVLDDTMVKGLEPWGGYGIRPINEKVVKDGVIIVVSNRKPSDLVAEMEKKKFPYRLAILPGEASFAGLWYFKDDMTDVRILGAIAKVAPEITSIDTVANYVATKYKSKEKAAAARKAYEEVKVSTVNPGEGIDWPYPKPILPGWKNFDEGVYVKSVKRGFQMGPRGQNRNPDFKRGTSKTQRPVVRFDICTKCTLCWYDCPDEVFDPTTEGLYDVNYEYCTGCGRCAEVCPVEDCIVMVDELKFENQDSPYVLYKKDPEKYVKWAEDKKGKDRLMPSPVTGKGNMVTKVETPKPYKKGVVK
jgi:pyruvate ferredoxin oxidoreductase delta subunit